MELFLFCNGCREQGSCRVGAPPADQLRKPRPPTKSCYQKTLKRCLSRHRRGCSLVADPCESGAPRLNANREEMQPVSAVLSVLSLLHPGRTTDLYAACTRNCTAPEQCGLLKSSGTQAMPRIPSFGTVSPPSPWGRSWHGIAYRGSSSRFGRLFAQAIASCKMCWPSCRDAPQFHKPYPKPQILQHGLRKRSRNCSFDHVIPACFGLRGAAHLQLSGKI